MKTIPSTPRFPQKGFTLVEILVSVSILTLMMVVLAQLADLSSKSMNEGVRRADNFTKARAALDLFATDIANGVFRSDLGAFRDQNGAYTEAFFTRRPGVGGDRSLSLIAYRINPANSVLERGTQTILWTDPSIGFGDATKITRLSTLTATDYQEIASGVLKLQFYYIDAAGNYGTEYANAYNRDATGASYSTTEYSRAVGIALITVDETSYQLLKTLDKLDDLAAAFPVPGSQNKSYQKEWGDLLPSVVTDISKNYPASVRSNVRIFERVIPLPEL